MSNIPTPKNLPTTQQIDAVLGSVISGSQTLLNMDMKNYADLRASFLKFYSHPTFQLLLGLPPQNPPAPAPPDNQLKAELTELRSTISALSVTVAGLQPKAKEAKTSPPLKTPPPTGTPSAQGKGPKQAQTPTYASKAASKARPSLVLDIGANDSQPRLHSELAVDLTDELFDLGHPDVKISATRYTKKGNLVITAHHSTSQSQLNEASHDIITYIQRSLQGNNITPPNPNFKARANVKWSKILINSVPVGTNTDRGPYTPEECHRSLCAHNPSYATLKVTQKPSWVRQPSTLKPESHSSLVVAFEDPDGSLRRQILTNQQLYILGVRAKVTRWKEKPRQPQNNNPPEASQGAPSQVSRSNTPDVAMTEDHQSPTPTTSSTARKHHLPTTPTNPKPSGTKKKRVGSH